MLNKKFVCANKACIGGITACKDNGRMMCKTCGETGVLRDPLTLATQDLLSTMDGATGGEWNSPFSGYSLPEVCEDKVLSYKEAEAALAEVFRL